MSRTLHNKCLVIGGGVSGLKTAHSLLNDAESKFKPEDILVVEAQDRIGGRILTDKTSSKLGYSYDIGGAWFHDSLTNINLKEATERGIFDISTDGYFDDMDMVFYDEHFKGPIPVSKLKLNRVASEFEKFVEIYYYEDLNRKDMSMLEIADIYVQKYGSRLTDVQKKYVAKIARFYELWFGVSSDVMSAKFSPMSHEGRDLYNLKGYSFIIDDLLEKIPSSCIKKNTQVTRISRNNPDTKRIAVETNKGTIHCDYLVVTVPLSILKLPQSHPYGITWEPELPKSIQEALSASEFGALGKVIFEFDDMWWDADTERILYLADDTPTTNFSKPLTKLPSKVGYPYLIINYEAMHKNKQKPRKGASFVILTQAPLTHYLEAHPEEAFDYFKKSFESFALPGKTITTPINVITTKWTQNPYIRGAYGAIEVNGNDDIVVQLSGEVEGVGLSFSTVRFAGEHTASDGNGCIHGAYASGLREANWIISHYNSTKPAL